MKKKFTIEVEMEEEWINHFMSMLNHMEYLGNIGSSRKVSIYSDGDGSFRPKFETDVNWEEVEPINQEINLYDRG